MSYANILSSSGTIAPQYLPTGPAPAHPYVENPFQDAVDGGNQLLTNLAGLSVGSATAPPVGILLEVDGNTLVNGKMGVALNKYIEDDGAGNIVIENGAPAPGGKLNFQGPAGLGEVYDTVNNPLPSEVTTKYIRLSGTNAVPAPGLAIPQSNNANPGKTIATLDLSTIGNNTSFNGYVNIVTGQIENPDSATIAYQVFLSDTLNGAYNSAKGLAILKTGVLTAGTIVAPGETYTSIPINFQASAPTQTLYLNVQSLDPGTGPVGGSTWQSTQYTIDLYAF